MRREQIEVPPPHRRAVLLDVGGLAMLQASGGGDSQATDSR